MTQIKKPVVEILCGLPGSGKTTYATSQSEAHNRKHRYTPSYKFSSGEADRLAVLDMDHYARQGRPKAPQGSSITEALKRAELTWRLRETDRIILDGLFTTQAQYAELVGNLKGATEIVFVFWDEDRAACLHNDRYRREQDAAFSIEHLPLEVPDLEALQAIAPDVKLTLKRMKVVRKDDYQIFLDKYRLSKRFDVEYGELRSRTWSLGGTWRNCYGESGSISGEAPPAGFSEFDDLLGEIWPDLTFLQYKKLYNETVTTKERSDSDYYSDREVGYYACDLQALFERLDAEGKLNLD